MTLRHNSLSAENTSSHESVSLSSNIEFTPAFQDSEKHIRIYQRDTFDVLKMLLCKKENGVFDMIFVDPPYFLSNGGITCQNGRMACVDKGKWDRSRGVMENHKFHTEWLSLCQKLLKPNGTLWVTGTSHVIFSVGFAIQELGYKILNNISWEKPNPPPNLSCRYFTHSTETIIWAAKNEQSKHFFDYAQMKQMAGGKQMKTVWKIYPPKKEEKVFGKHPAQKPVELIERCLSASTKENDLVLDPFMGCGSSLIACLNKKRRFIGVEQDGKWVDIAIKRMGHYKEYGW